jgi:transketolase
MSGALTEEATTIRREIVEALYACGGGHYGGSLSVVDILLALYRCQLRIPPAGVDDPTRDRLLLSKGHAALALYAVQRRVGFYAHALDGYGRASSPLQGHPDVSMLPAVEFSTGSLGQGLAVGLGMALALRGTGPRVWVILGDGECQEGQVWETAMLAARYGVDNVTAIVDVNGFQECGWTPPLDPAPVPALDAKLTAFGWHVLTVDGHDHDALARTYAAATRIGGRPTAILARTVKGKSVPCVEADPVRYHCTTVTAAEHAAMLQGLT